MTLTANTIYTFAVGSDIRCVSPLSILYYRPVGDGTITSPASWSRYSGASSESLQCTVQTYVKATEDTDIEVISGVA